MNFDEGYFHCPGPSRRVRRLPAVGTGIDRELKETQSDDRYVRLCFPRTIQPDQGQADILAQANVRADSKSHRDKLRPKDMRDIFASTVETDDARVLMALMRHTNLTTTTKYLRAMHERMKEAVSR